MPKIIFNSEKLKVRKLYASGLSLSAVAMQTNLAITTVHNIVTPANIRSRNKKHAYEREYLITAAYRRRLMNYAKDHNYVLVGLADKLNVPISYLRYLRREAIRKGSTIARRK